MSGDHWPSGEVGWQRRPSPQSLTNFTPAPSPDSLNMVGLLSRLQSSLLPEIQAKPRGKG